MISSNQEYWVQLLNKLNDAQDMDMISKEVLEELCQHFGFGVGFIYETDYKGNYHLKSAYQLYPLQLPQTIESDTFLTMDEEKAIRERKMLYFRSSTCKGALEKKLMAAFEAKSMVMVPVCSQEGDMIALVGIMDRRGEVRYQEEDVNFTAAVLTTLGTYIKMQIYQNRIQTAQKSLESILNHMGVDVYVNDFETHEILYLNESMAKPYGDVEALIGQHCWEALYKDKTGECDYCPKPKLLDEEGKPTKIYGWDYQRPFDGSWFRVLSAAFPWVDGRMAQVVSSIDITENKRNEEIIRRTAEYDMLTALPNRYRLTVDMDKNLAELEKDGLEGYVLFFDLDGFKQVNDSMGHVVGDELLTKVGEFLQSSPLTRNRSYRYGGDEFVVLWSERCPGTLQEVIAYLQEGFSRQWQLKSCAVRCGASIGISHYPSDGNLSSSLVRNADQAMYASKKAGKGAVSFFNGGEPLVMKQ